MISYLDSWRDVEGWLSEDEGAMLQRLALDKFVLDIGTYTGRSAICMALAAAYVITVDRYEHHILRENIRRHGVENRVRVLTCLHEDLARVLLPASFGLAFVDGGHEQRQTTRDITTARDLIIPTGVIAVHDYGNPDYPGVTQAVLDALPRDAAVETVGQLAILRLTGGALR